MKYYTSKPGKYPEKKKNNSSNEFLGDGWSVKHKENDIYILSYISGSLQGQLKTIQITEDDNWFALIFNSSF